MPKFDYESFVGPDQAIYGPHGSQVTYNTGILGGIVTIANGLFAAVMITIMIRGEWGAAVAIIVSGLYYGVTTLAALLILSGALTQIVTNQQEQITRRQYHVLQVQRTALPDPMQSVRSLSASPTFVAPVDDSDYRAALAYVAALYSSDGQPDGKRVALGTSDPGQEGRLRVANPPRSTLEWLVARNVLQPITKRGIVNGYRLNTIACPTLSAARTALEYTGYVPPTPAGYGG